jgi:hypothetical protein
MAIPPVSDGSWYRVYVAAAILCFAASWALVILRAEVGVKHPLDLLTSNGFAYYAYLPSALLDGDLDLSNQAQAWRGIEGSVWMLHGRYPIGVSLTLLPSFLCAHAVSWLAYSISGAEAVAPTGFTIIYLLFNVAFIMAFWTAAMMALDRMILRRYQVHQGSAVAGILVYWLGSYFLWYFLLDPFWAHVLSSTWIVIVVCLVERIITALDERRFLWWHWPVLAFATSMAVVCRVTDVFLVPFFAYLVYRVFRGGFLIRALAVSPLIIAGMLPIALQWVVWGHVHGSLSELNPAAVGYGEQERFYWMQPVFFRMLFSSLNGLFFWSPILLASVWGLIWQLSRCGGWRDAILVCLVLSAAVLCYINGSWYAWYFGVAVGARAFLELGVLFILGFAFAFQRLRSFRTVHRGISIALLAMAVFLGYSLMALHHRSAAWRPQRAYLFEWEKRIYAPRTGDFQTGESRQPDLGPGERASDAER